MAEEWSETGRPDFTNAAGRTAALEEYFPRVGDARPNLGTRNLHPDLDDAALIREIQRTGARFGDESTAAYHSFKHAGGELPPSEAARSVPEMQRYLDSARDTILNPTRVDPPKVRQDGGKAVTFVREAEGHTMTAIVGVDRDGNMNLLTYMGKPPP